MAVSPPDRRVFPRGFSPQGGLGVVLGEPLLCSGWNGRGYGGDSLPWSFHFRPLCEDRELKGKMVCHKTKDTSMHADTDECG